jgi:hypothetical protein
MTIKVEGIPASKFYIGDLINVRQFLTIFFLT